MKRLLALSALVTLAFATPAAADIGKGNGEIGFDLGFTNFDSKVSGENGGRFVFRGGYHFTDLFQLEGQDGASATTENVAGTDVDTLLVNGVFNFHPKKATIVPYVLVGAGFAHTEFDDGSKIDDNGFAYQVAGGARFFFGKKDQVAVRVEISAINEDTFDETSTHTNLIGGFTWRLGSGK